MTSTLLAGAALALSCSLCGCAVYAPANADGAVVRQLMAAQIIPPQPRAASGSDGAAAVAAYSNYQRSYVTPTPQGDGATFGSVGAK